MKFLVNGKEHEMNRKDARTLERLNWKAAPGRVLATIRLGERLFRTHLRKTDRGFQCWINGLVIRLDKACDDSASSGGGSLTDGPLRVPFACRLVDVKVAEGQVVDKGEALFVIESMKMEQVINAAGKVRVLSIHGTAGASLERDQVVMLVESVEEPQNEREAQ